MIVTRMNFEYPSAAKSNLSKAGQSARTLLKNLTSAAATKGNKDAVENMSLSELLYFALVDQSAMA